MKLPGWNWMHRKLRQNSGDAAFKDFTGGGNNPCNCLSGRASLEEEHRGRRGHADGFPWRSLRVPEEENPRGGQAAGEVEVLYGGLLTIGTLGSGGPFEEAEEDAEIPAAVEAIAEKQAEATTETDLMVVSSELEKALATEAEAEAEAEKAAGGGASSIDHCVSSARHSLTNCPLQGFLFGSPIEAIDIAQRSRVERAATSAERRERHRASLGELFMRSRMAEEGGSGGKRAARIVKKLLKPCGTWSSDGGADDAVAAETNLQKILQIFNRKVHPENSDATKKSTKPGKSLNRDNVPHGGAKGSGRNGQTVGASKTGCRKENIPSFKCCSSPPPSIPLGGSDSNGNREHWIKTDADYLVLEL